MCVRGVAVPRARPEGVAKCNLGLLSLSFLPNLIHYGSRSEPSKRPLPRQATHRYSRMTDCKGTLGYKDSWPQAYCKFCHT